MFRNQREWLRFQQDSGGNDGGGNNNSDGNDGGDDQSGAVAFQNALQRHNSNVEAFARQLFDDNYRLRNANRDLRSQTAPAGSVILQSDELQQWQAYRALGNPGDLVLASTVTTVQTDLTNAQTALATAQTENTALKRGQLLREVADAAGMVHGVLATLDKPEMSYTITDGKDSEGKPTKVVKVKAGDQETDLDAYAAQHWSVFLPALRPTQQNSGTPFILQVGGGGKQSQQSAASVAGNYLSQRYGQTQKAQ